MPEPISQLAVRFWLCIAMLATGLALFIFSNKDATAALIAAGTIITTAIGLIAQIMRGESKADSLRNEIRAQLAEDRATIAEEKAVIAKHKAEDIAQNLKVVEKKVETVVHAVEEHKLKCGNGERTGKDP